MPNRRTPCTRSWMAESFWHRMGDVGYLDDIGRFWFCGRKAHRVVHACGTLFSVPVESVLNEHPRDLSFSAAGPRPVTATSPRCCLRAVAGKLAPGSSSTSATAWRAASNCPGE